MKIKAIRIDADTIQITVTGLTVTVPPPIVPPPPLPPSTGTIGSLVTSSLVAAAIRNTSFVRIERGGVLQHQMLDVIEVIAQSVGLPKTVISQACPTTGKTFPESPAHKNPPATYVDIRYPMTVLGAPSDIWNEDESLNLTVYALQKHKDFLTKFRAVYPRCGIYVDGQIYDVLGLPWLRVAPYHRDHFHCEPGDVIDLGVKV